MKIVTDWRDVDRRLRGAAIALAEVDGFHRGHQHVLANAAFAAKRLGAPLGVIGFEPHPGAWRASQGEPQRLMTHRQQVRMLAALGVDVFYVLPFDAELAGMSGGAFAGYVLAAGLGARHVAIGADYGAFWGEDPGDLARQGEAFDFSVSIALGNAATRPQGGANAAVRAALTAGRPERAAEIMGRPFSMEGVVVKGQQLGRQLGFPTANVAAGDYVRPRLGVYATRSRLDDGREFAGVANFGVNPTTGLVDARLEVCLFDFDEDIYGRGLETELVAFLRPELKFSSLPALVEQIHKDADQARAILTDEVQQVAARG